MGIDIHIENENGSTLQVLYADNKNVIVQIIDKLQNNEFWKIVDPYGDTVFNHLQFPILFAEINKIDISIFDSNIKNEIIKIKTLIQNIEMENHTYIRLVGD